VVIKSLLPEIDLAPFLAAPMSAAGRDLVLRLRDACHAPGFCYLVGHGVPRELDDAVMANARELFLLPVAERRALAIANSPHFRGYTELGGERTKGVSDWREQLDVGPEEAATVVAPGDAPWRRPRGPNQWPASLPALRTTNDPIFATFGDNDLKIRLRSHRDVAQAHYGDCS
jgi:isopenicillin N synthase-like dioxygenase